MLEQNTDLTDYSADVRDINETEHPSHAIIFTKHNFSFMKILETFEKIVATEDTKIPIYFPKYYACYEREEHIVMIIQKTIPLMEVIMLRKREMNDQIRNPNVSKGYYFMSILQGMLIPTAILHSMNIYHGYLKQSNYVIHQAGNSFNIKLTNFHFAHSLLQGEGLKDKKMQPLMWARLKAHKIQPANERQFAFKNDLFMVAVSWYSAITESNDIFVKLEKLNKEIESYEISSHENQNKIFLIENQKAINQEYIKFLEIQDFILEKELSELQNAHKASLEGLNQVYYSNIYGIGAKFSAEMIMKLSQNASHQLNNLCVAYGQNFSKSSEIKKQGIQIFNQHAYLENLKIEIQKEDNQKLKEILQEFHKIEMNLWEGLVKEIDKNFESGKEGVKCVFSEMFNLNNGPTNAQSILAMMSTIIVNKEKLMTNEEKILV
jgi:hypothetical protein